MFKLRLASLCVLFLSSFSTAYADTKTLTADASYLMGDAETPDFAEARALQKAKQTALEEAGTYVQSYTKVQNLDLTAEEIQIIAGGVIQVEVLEKTRSLVADGLRFYTKIKATVTTDKMEELARRIKGKDVAEDYQKLQVEYARISRELENWKQQVVKIQQGPERTAVLDRIREQEREFSQVQQREGEFFQRLISGRKLLEQANHDKEIIDRLLATILSDGHILTVGEAQAVVDLEKKDHFVLKVPLTIRLTKAAQEAMSQSAKALAGSIQPDMVLLKKPIRVDSEIRTHVPVTLVRLANDPKLDAYFQQGIDRFGFQVTFLDGTSTPPVCFLDILSGYNNRSNRDDAVWMRVFRYSTLPWMQSFQHNRRQLESNAVVLDEYVVMVNEEVKLVVEHTLSGQSVKSLTRVVAQAVEAPRQVPQGSRCRMVP